MARIVLCHVTKFEFQSAKKATHEEFERFKRKIRRLIEP